MKVRDRMSPNPITVSPDSTVGEAWRLMSQHRHTHLPVMDHNQVLGIVTLKDFGTKPYFEFIGTNTASRYMSHDEEKILHKVRVRDVMPEHYGAVTIGPDAYIEQAAKLLLDNKLSGMPVVDEGGQLVGIITQTDIMGAFLDLLSVNGHGTRIKLRVNDSPDTLCAIGQILSKYATKIENLVTMKVNGDAPLMVMQIDTTEVKPIINEFRAAGFEVESTLVRP